MGKVCFPSQLKTNPAASAGQSGPHGALASAALDAVDSEQAAKKGRGRRSKRAAAGDGELQGGAEYPAGLKRRRGVSPDAHSNLGSVMTHSDTTTTHTAATKVRS
jgi:hypothetical protein